MKRLFTTLFVSIALMLMTATLVLAQNRTISGSVKSDENGRMTGLPGVNVVVDGTTTGTLTDADGNFVLEVPENVSSLTFSFIGYKSKTLNIGGGNPPHLDVILESDVKTLDEVIVVGYGTQKVKDLTSAIVTVDLEDIAKSPTGQPMQALQGKVPGVQIVNNGAPGATPTVRIRGIGSSQSDSAPLYVVDGMFFDSIDFLNMADIASMNVLKDASAAAIYGVRAANGVVLITTKSGSVNQKPEITYDGYYGIQRAQNVLQMANSEQFAQMARESVTDPAKPNTDYSFVLNAMQRFGRSRVNPNVPDVNTDWYKEITRVAPIQNHSLGITGSNGKTTYAIGANYFGQLGILAMKNQYERFNLRTKLDFKVNDWITAGGNIVLTNALQYHENAGAWGTAYYAVPTMPVHDYRNKEENKEVTSDYASATILGYRGPNNPFLNMDFQEKRTKTKKVLSNFYLNFDLISKKLTYKLSYSNSYTSAEWREAQFSYYIHNSAQVTTNKLTKNIKNWSNYIVDNVLTYTDNFGKHNVSVMAGYAYRSELYQGIEAAGTGFRQDYPEDWYISQSTNKPSNNVQDFGDRIRGLSWFGRMAYNFADKYLLYGTVRWDGSQKYQEKWGFFPSVGAGWVVSEENFMKGNSMVDYLKIRGSWGRLGNDKIAGSSGSNTVTTLLYPFNDVELAGLKSTNQFSWLGWERTEETNIGLSARFLRNRLSVEADYYIRDTQNAAIVVTPPFRGTGVIKNVGILRNSGLEVALNWNDAITKDFSYRAGINFATLKNTVRDIYGQESIETGSGEYPRRYLVGEPINAFYGYKVRGVYQNQAEIEADPTIKGMAGIKPGFFKYEDTDGDNKLTQDDRRLLGAHFPNFTYGANLGANYKNFEFSVFLMGQMGNKILNFKRGIYNWTTDGNMDADLAKNRWHGEGTTDKYPSSEGLRTAWNLKASNFFIEDGSFWRIQNLQAAYNIRGIKLAGKKFPDTRISLTAERPLTYFTYHGFDPEVADGWDSQTYPVPAVYTMGLSVKF